jgi:hypothetical protein
MRPLAAAVVVEITNVLNIKSPRPDGLPNQPTPRSIDAIDVMPDDSDSMSPIVINSPQYGLQLFNWDLNKCFESSKISTARSMGVL